MATSHMDELRKLWRAGPAEARAGVEAMAGELSPLQRAVLAGEYDLLRASSTSEAQDSFELALLIDDGHAVRALFRATEPHCAATIMDAADKERPRSLAVLMELMPHEETVDAVRSFTGLRRFDAIAAMAPHCACLSADWPGDEPDYVPSTLNCARSLDDAIKLVRTGVFKGHSDLALIEMWVKVRGATTWVRA